MMLQLPQAGPAIEHLIHAYPDYLTIDDLPLSGQYKDQVNITWLYETRILM